MKEKFVPQSEKNLINNLNHCGPLFGDSYPDLGVEDDFKNKTKAWGNFPKNYNRTDGNKLECNQDT